MSCLVLEIVHDFASKGISRRPATVLHSRASRRNRARFGPDNGAVGGGVSLGLRRELSDDSS
eukprot:5103104-Alexandrium_andersonii.AAC.1